MSLYDELKQLQAGFQAAPVGYQALAQLIAGVEALVERYRPEGQMLAVPPSGWYVFGTHASWTTEDLEGLLLEFSEEHDEAGLPLWERRV